MLIRSKTILKTFALLLFLTWGSTTIGQTSGKNLQELIRAVRESKDDSEKLNRMIELGNHYVDINLKDAEDMRIQINRLARSMKTKRDIRIDLFNVKVLELQRRHTEFAAILSFYADRDLRAYPKDFQYELNYNLGYSSVIFQNFDRANDYFKKALVAANELNNYSAKCSTLCVMAFGEMLNTNKTKALSIIEKAKTEAYLSSNNLDFGNVFYFQGFIYDHFGQPEIALSKYLLALDYAKLAKNLSKMSIISAKVGGKQVLIKNYKEALHYFQLAESAAESYQDFRLLGIALSLQANVYRLQERYIQALRKNDTAFVFLSEVKNAGALGVVELNYGKIYTDFDAYPLAISHLQKAINFLENSNSKEIISEVYQLEGEIAVKRGQPEKALKLFLMALDMVDKHGASEESVFIYPQISQIYKEKGDAKKALVYLEKYIDFIKVKEKEVASKKIAELNELYRSNQRERLIAQQSDILEKQRREKELTETKLENISLRNNSQTYILIGFMIFTIMAIVIAIYRSRQGIIQSRQKEIEMSQSLLRSQMNPHFIFNAMSVIQSYIFENDTKNSSRFLVHFSRLIRLILENSPKEFVPIDTEIEILEKYLITQKLRFEDRFNYTIICPDELLFDKILIPPMITQPFIENSIEHGQLHTIPNGKIEIRFSQLNNMLLIQIEDNGIGREKASELKQTEKHKSMAMEITKNRISLINGKYHTAGQLKINNLDEDKKTGTKVLISLPYLLESPTKPRKTKL